MKTLATSFCIFIFITLLQCTLFSQVPKGFFEIKYEEILKNARTITLSQVATKVEYIKLETRPDCMITGFPKYFITDSLIFVNNNDHVLKFSRNGKFLKRIGNPGRGPGEIDMIKFMSVIPSERIITIQKNRERTLLYFSFDGDLIKSITVSGLLFYKVLNNGNIIAYDNSMTGTGKYTFRLTNENNDTIATVKNNWMWETRGVVKMTYTGLEPFYLYRNRYCFKSMYNDTVYTLISKRIVPVYSVDLGKYTIPEELRPEKLGASGQPPLTEKSGNYFYANLLEAGNRVFLTSACYGNSPNRRILYNTINHTGNVLENSSGRSAGILNDWDGGIDFWPAGNVSDNQVFTSFSILELQRKLQKGETSGDVRSMEDQRKLQRIFTESDEADNPVLMIVTLK